MKAKCFVNWFASKLRSALRGALWNSEQACVLKFGSWTYDDRQLNLSLGEPSITLKDYTEHSELGLHEAKVKVFSDAFNYSDNVAEIYPTVRLCLRFKRWPLYYYINLMVPAVLTLAISVVVFILPTNSNEKMSLSKLLLIN